MQLQCSYTVFSADPIEVATQFTTPSGKTVNATESALMVQLLPHGHAENGTIKLVITEGEDAAAQLFVAGKTVTATFIAAE